MPVIMKGIYFDACCIQRPLDAPDSVRVVLESHAILSVLGLCGKGVLTLVSSEILEFETENVPDGKRRFHAQETLRSAQEFVSITDEVIRRSKQFVRLGVDVGDAIHLSLALLARADYFCTCDDKFLGKARKLGLTKIKVVSPLDLVKELKI
ncbi:MAG TPA: PIN domain-containing protein [Planctomycetota bacterium]|nr:PIN domain-containing protein [Planctomycetota bacterium]